MSDIQEYSMMDFQTQDDSSLTNNNSLNRLVLALSSKHFTEINIVMSHQTGGSRIPKMNPIALHTYIKQNISQSEMITNMRHTRQDKVLFTTSDPICSAPLRGSPSLGKCRGWRYPEPATAFPCWAPWWAGAYRDERNCISMGSRNIVPDGEACPSNSPAKENNADARFFILSLKEGSFKSVSPIVIHKTILAMVGEVKTIKKCKNGKLLIETANDKQAALIVNLKKIGENEITVAPHYSLNQAKGVISESEFQNDTDSDIMEYLRNQNVSAVKRISVRKDGQYVPTKHLILTFNVPTLPKSVIIAYINCPVRPYIPNPLRCYKCQKFGHSIQSCRGTETCA
ncbi:hypothetical protein AVEN_259152-1, partial [Araneus ventricosus]